MRRFLECLTTNTTCNLHCSYCYLIQQNRRTNQKAHFDYSAEHIGKALRKDRLGGTSLISITAQGETLIPMELPHIVLEILKQAHFVNITTNGTLSRHLEKLLEATQGYHDHLHFSFSFHYVELKKRKLLDTFFENIRKAWNDGCSILLQINLVDEYIPYWDEIKRLSIKYVGALPQVALTRVERNGNYDIFSELTFPDYVKIGKEMQSPLFDFTCVNFNQKRREFCYAGWWSGVLNMETGELRGCYGQGFCYNIFKNVEEDIPFAPIGKNCQLKYCVNSSHFMSQGVIPSLLPLPSYGELRNREEAHWYQPEMKQFLYAQFEDVNQTLPMKTRMIMEYHHRIMQLKRTRIMKYIGRVKRKLF